MINFGNSFINCTNPSAATLSDVADHIDHIVQVAGIDHVGLGADYDGVGGALPIGLEGTRTRSTNHGSDVSKYPDLVAELLSRGYGDADIIKIIGGSITHS